MFMDGTTLHFKDVKYSQINIGLNSNQSSCRQIWNSKSEIYFEKHKSSWSYDNFGKEEQKGMFSLYCNII
jgi:hypothetical protein